MKKQTQMKIAKLCLVGMMVSTFAGISVNGKAYADTWPDIDEAKIKSAQPHFSGYTVRNIEAWNNETDPYSDLMRARVPLQKKNDAFPATQANPGLNDRTEVMLMQGDYGNSFFNSTVANNSYGNLAFNFWQYTDYFCPWHGAATVGSPSELYDPATSHYRTRGFEFGIVNIPNQAYINAAHKNGVKAIACVYFDATYRPGQTKQEMFVKDTNGEYAVANKLIELAKYYGIDGYFLNDEEPPASEEFKDFMAYLTKNGLYTQFYDTNSSFNANKSQWLKDDKHGQIHNSVFVNYGWNNVQSFVEHAKAIGSDPYKEMFLGIEGNQGEYKEQMNTLVKKAYTSETDKNPLGSIALFTPSDMYQRGIDGLEGKLGLKGKLPVHQRNEYQWMVAERERMYFSGVTCDPKDTGSHTGYKREDVVVDDASYWPGVADFKAETSVIKGKKFYSNFNIGKGIQYFVNGKLANDEAWTDLNDQDILPSWQWWFESAGDKLKADFDFGEKEVRNDINGNKRDLPFKQIGAYNGGSSLVVYGKSSDKNTLRLFKTDLDVTASTKAKLAFRKTSNDNAKMKLGLIFAENPDETVELDIADTEAMSDEYKEAVVDLSEYQGKKIAAISLVFDGNADDYQMNIGSISVSDEEIDEAAPTGFEIERIYADKQMVFKWNIDNYETVDKYRVYAESEGKKHFLGGIYDEKLYVKNHFAGDNAKVKFTLVKVGKDGKESQAAEKEVDFSKLPKDVKVEETTPVRQFKINESEDGESTKEVVKNIRLHNETIEAGRVAFSFKKADDTVYEAVVNPIKEYTDDKFQPEYKSDVAGENGIIDVADIKDGYYYDLTIKAKNSDVGISYRGKFNDSYARPMTENDVVWAGKKMIALRSPLTRDWHKVEVKFEKDGKVETVSVEPYVRGVTSGYHSPFTIPDEKGNLILTLTDYKGNATDLKFEYDETYKAELIKLRDEYSIIVKDRELAKILFKNPDLDNILDRLQDKLKEANVILSIIKKDEAKVNAAINELKAIYGELEESENVVDYSFKLLLPTSDYVDISFSLKDEDGTVLNPRSSNRYIKERIYSYILEKGKKYTYEVSSSEYGTIRIVPVEGSVEVKEREIKEIPLTKMAVALTVTPKADTAIKRLESINKDNYEVEVKYSHKDREKLLLSDSRLTVDEVDTSVIGEKTVRVRGFNNETEFKVMVVPNASDPAELNVLWNEVKAAKELKEKAEYKYASKGLKEAFDLAILEAETAIKENIQDVNVLKEIQARLKAAKERLNGLSRQPVSITPSSTGKCLDNEYFSFPIGNIIDGNENTFAWFESEQKVGDEVKLSFSDEVKVSAVSIIYPADLGFDGFMLKDTLLKGDEEEGEDEEDEEEDDDDEKEDNEDDDQGGEGDEQEPSYNIKKADIEVKQGETWTKIGEISGKDKTEVVLAEGKEVTVSEVRLKITENSKNQYRIAEFKVKYEEIEKAPDLTPLKNLLKEELKKADSVKNTAKYIRADKDKKDKFNEAFKKAENLLTAAKTEAEIEEAITLLREALNDLDGKEEEKPNPPVPSDPSAPSNPQTPAEPPTVVYPPVPANPPAVYSPAVVFPKTPAVPKPEETKEEAKAEIKPEIKTEAKQEEKKSETKTSEQEIREDETPKGEAPKETAKKIKTLILHSSKNLIKLNTLKALAKTNVKAVVFEQKKAKINASITAGALDELVSKKVSSLTIRGKSHIILLSAKDLKRISKAASKKITFKVVKNKTGKAKIVIYINGKKLSAKDVAKLKIKLKTR